MPHRPEAAGQARADRGGAWPRLRHHVRVGDYCERTASGLWGEPFNAVSNLAFLIASGMLLWLAAVVLFVVGYSVLDRYRRGSGPRVRPAEPADHGWIVRTLTAAWGSTTAVAHGVAYDAGTLPALIAEAGGARTGLLTYLIADGAMEVVTVDAVARRRGAGTALLAAAADVARAAGAGRLWLVTTNDNIDALRFYQRRGLRIVGVTPGGVEASRLLKPSIPTVGSYGIPLRDELTLELRI